MANLFPKRCKVYPRNNMQYISGILEKQERIELPAELPLSERELRRCLSYANCFEMVGAKHVLLTLDNYNEDNTNGKDVTDTLPEGELTKPRDKEAVDEGTGEGTEDQGKPAKANVEEKKTEHKQANIPAQKSQNNQQKQQPQQQNNQEKQSQQK